MIRISLPHAALGAAAFALSLAFGGLTPTSPAQAEPLPVVPTGCYLGAEGNYYFAVADNACSAPTGSIAGTDRWDTTGFVGISFSIGDGFNPHISVGLRHTNVNASSFVYGGEINASIALLQGFEDAQIRLLGIVGNAETLGVGLLGNAGIGWDFGANSLLVNAGLQVPYARLFIDYTIDDSSWRAFFEVNSYGKIEAIQGTLTCGAGTVMASGAEILQQWADFVHGTDVQGDIFDGSFEWGSTEHFAGTPSDAFVNGQTCFERGHSLG